MRVVETVSGPAQAEDRAQAQPAVSRLGLFITFCADVICIFFIYVASRIL